MEERMQKNSWLRKIRTLAVVGVMTIVGAGSAWGQDGATITKASNNTANDAETGVHIKKEIIYVDGSRELYVPELRISRWFDTSFDWYVHWYPEDASKVSIEAAQVVANMNEAQLRGGDFSSTDLADDVTYDSNTGIYTSPSRLYTDSGNGLWWAAKADPNDKHHGIEASTIKVSLANGVTEGIVICDVSNNTNDHWDGQSNTYTEPTLLKRYIYIIKPAKEYVNNLNTNGPEKFSIDFPQRCSTINFTMPSLPSNYFWGTEGAYSQGERFVYSTNKNSGYKDFTITLKGNFGNGQTTQTTALTSQRVQQIDLSSVNSSITYYVKARNGDNYSPIIAEFTFNPVANSGFILEDKGIPSDRKPWENGDLYEEIGIVDFDMESVESTLSKENNTSPNPLPRDETAYGFLQKDIASFQNSTSTQNQYGLYRSANAPESLDGEQISNISGKTYLWIPPFMDDAVDGINVYTRKDGNPGRILYDRTHMKNSNQYGYFYYIDATDEPGTIVNVSIDGMLCGYTELVVVAWLADMTRARFVRGGNKYPLPPNINLILKGYDTKNKEEVVLHRFTSGDALTDYDSSEHPGYNMNLMKWQQLCYRITLTEEDIENYTDFHLEVQNNEPHTDGADYAIDDVCIYKTKPNIRVARKDECDASTLTVSSDYGTLLRNMGWKAGQDVPNTKKRPAHMQQYNYGFPEGAERNKYGNIYFAFLEGLKEVEHEDGSTELIVGTDGTDLSYEAKDKLDEDIKPIVVEDGKYRWVRVNRSLTNPSYQSVYSYRVVISTDINKLPTDETAALAQEKQWNFQAVLDFNADTKRGWAADRKDKIPESIDIKEDGTITTIDKGDGMIAQKTLTIDNIATDTEEYNRWYTTLGEELYKYLQIPRMRCPWRTTENGVERLNLYEMDVTVTDLMYVGEEYGQDASGNPLTASGKYHVMLFSANQINNYANPTEVGRDVVASPCALISPFEVQPSATILVRTTSDDNTAICLGTLKKITAELNFYEDKGGKDVPTEAPSDLDYVFDWYLGSRADYDAIEENYKFTVKDAIVNYREKTQNTTKSFKKEDLKSWSPSNSDMKRVLEFLFDQELLLTGTTPGEAFDLKIEQEQIVAMPYVQESYSSGDKTYIYCTEETNVDLRISDNLIPEIHLGFPDVTYPFDEEVPLRLGHVNMGATIPLTIPVRNNFGSTMAGDKLGKPTTGATVSIEVSPNTYEDVGILNELDISKEEQNATIKITFNDNAKNVLLEGHQYDLFIPFIQYQGNSILTDECDGLISLPVKIVPEYLTWKGDPTYLWQSDMKNWTISTSDELYKKVSNTVETPSYSPLYFTKITIPGGEELQLKKPESEGRVLKSWTSEGDDNFRYDMAVNNTGTDKAIEVVPYYINDIEQIYFKPGATLLNQHLLTYDKAWVEFEMTPGADYWMASPLQEVYAGDMYAPTIGGQQNTPAFTPIKYDDDNKNDRWNPAFYQKAWNRGVTYADAETGGDATSKVTVEAVKSNWSIEYNNTTTPYSIGKGFYLRGEDDDATENTVKVRLPKNDEHYTYETRAADGINNVDTKTNQKNLADLDADDGSMTLDLLTKVDNDGDHFLVGNPYMAYLDMGEFLEANSSVLAPKYWTIDVKERTVSVGTPDVAWGKGANSGYVAPMQAFFVERAGYNPSATTTKADGETTEAKKVTFKASMTVAAATAETDTKSFSAVNPILTLTATSKQGQSRAAVVQKSDASNQYEADKDAVALLDSEIDAPMAYTVAGSYAAAVNAIHDYKNVPLGVYAKDGEEVELSIEGASQLVSPLYLYDAVTRSTTPIDDDSFTLNLTGSSHGRYFLTTDEGIKAEGDIRIYSPADGQLIIASTPSDRLKQVQVYDLNGRMVESRQNVGTATCQLYVPGGIYIVRVQSEQGEAQAKLKIK